MQIVGCHRVHCVLVEVKRSRQWGSRWLIITILLMPVDPVAANPLVDLLYLDGGCP